MTERNGVQVEMEKLGTEAECREIRTEAEMPETVVKDRNVDRIDGAENGMERT